MLPRRPGPRSTAIVATVMALFLLAVSQLTPGNARDRFGPTVDSPVVVAVQKACGHDNTGDHQPSDGRHQSDTWAAPAAPQPRPPSDTTGILLPDLRTLPGPPGPAAPPVDVTTPVAAAQPQPGVLRI
ncbi:hypothetical protein [Actinoplanes philippinensis]|uniref:hypothetical protein n=1 Tax=Actinoplanes philippinensis TaxID=35752 RepID=UPI0034064C85